VDLSEEFFEFLPPFGHLLDNRQAARIGLGDPAVEGDFQKNRQGYMEFAL
jgi:hypothetical protein